MARFAPIPAPGRGELLRSPVHRIVRRYPEALALLLGAGVDPASLGGTLLDDLDDGGALAEELLAGTAWRPSPEGPRGKIERAREPSESP